MVYDRKFHPFNIRDVVRIIKSIPEVVIVTYPEDQAEAIEALLLVPAEAATDQDESEESQADEEAAFGGGEFGGAGVSGSFTGYDAVLLIKEEALEVI